MMWTVYQQRLCVLLLLWGVGLESPVAAEECQLIGSRWLEPDLDLGGERVASPCPADPSPCTCSCQYDPKPPQVFLNVTCLMLNSGNDLKDVFEKFEGLKTYTNFRVIASQLGDLPPDTFNGVTFREMQFVKAGLTSDGGNLATSKATLQSISIIEDSSGPLEWPLSADFSEFNSLESLFVKGPYKGPTTALNFPALRTLALSTSSMDAVTDQTFNSLSALEKLVLSGTPVKTLPANVFRDLTNLIELTVVSGSLTTLDDDSLHLLADNIGTINLSDNEIVSVNPDAFNVNNEDVNIALLRNEIAALKRTELEPLVTKYGTVSVEGNPFNCDCDDDMIWIIDTRNNATLEEVKGAYDQCNFPTGVDPKVLKKFYEYQCSPVPSS